MATPARGGRGVHSFAMKRGGSVGKTIIRALGTGARGLSKWPPTPPERRGYPGVTRGSDEEGVECSSIDMVMYHTTYTMSRTFCPSSLPGGRFPRATHPKYGHLLEASTVLAPRLFPLRTAFVKCYGWPRQYNGNICHSCGEVVHSLRYHCRYE